MVSTLMEEKEEAAKTREHQEQQKISCMVSILMEEKEEAAKRTTTSGDIDLSVVNGGHQNLL